MDKQPLLTAFLIISMGDRMVSKPGIQKNSQLHE